MNNSKQSTEVIQLNLVANARPLEPIKVIYPKYDWDYPDNHGKILSLVRCYVENARKAFHLSTDRLPMPVLSYKLRGRLLGKCRAFHGKNHWILFMNPIHVDSSHMVQVTNTVVHEICHKVTWILHGFSIMPHGREFEFVGEMLGHALSRVIQVPEYFEAARKIKAEKQAGKRKLKLEDF